MGRRSWACLAHLPLLSISLISQHLVCLPLAMGNGQTTHGSQSAVPSPQPFNSDHVWCLSFCSKAPFHSKNGLPRKPAPRGAYSGAGPLLKRTWRSLSCLRARSAFCQRPDPPKCLCPRFSTQDIPRCRKGHNLDQRAIKRKTVLSALHRERINNSPVSGNLPC